MAATVTDLAGFTAKISAVACWRAIWPGVPGAEDSDRARHQDGVSLPVVDSLEMNSFMTATLGRAGASTGRKAVWQRVETIPRRSVALP